MPNIEELIRIAMQEGKFDNLPGKGKPLKLNENPHADPDWRVSYHILQEAGFTLPWIETRSEIEVDLQSARNDLQRAWMWRESSLTEKQPSTSIESEWCEAKDALRVKVDALNKRIKEYNLTVPSTRFQMGFLNYEREVSAITASQTR